MTKCADAARKHVFHKKNASPVFSRVSTVLIWQEIVVQNEATHAKCYILMLRWLLYSGFTQNIANYGGFWALFDQKLGSRNENWIQHKTRVISGISFLRVITNALVYRILKILNKNVAFSVRKESEKLLSQKKRKKCCRAAAAFFRMFLMFFSCPRLGGGRILVCYEPG